MHEWRLFIAASYVSQIESQNCEIELDEEG